jgi:hypothetical protein
VGLAALYVVLPMWQSTRLRVDTFDRDGYGGWGSFVAVWRTVTWSLSLHAFALSVIVIAIGLANWILVAPLLVLWLVVFPWYVIAPRVLVLKKTSAWRAQEVRRLSRMIPKIDSGISQTDLLMREALRQEIISVRQRPAGGQRLRLATIVTVSLAVLPIGIALVELFVLLGNSTR